MKRSLKILRRTPKSARKLRVNENKWTEYTKKLMKEIPVGNVWRQEANATVCLGQWERTRLVGICNVKIGYQVSGMSEFGYGP